MHMGTLRTRWNRLKRRPRLHFDEVYRRKAEEEEGKLQREERELQPPHRSC